MKENTWVLIFMKIPAPGLVKTRLACAIGDESALELYVEMVRHTLAMVEKSGFQANVFYQGEGNPPEQLSAFPPSTPAIPQIGTDLGERMANGFRHAFEKGADSAILIGCDIPQLTVEILENANRHLKVNDVVFGPADDGGYYLIGFNRETFLPEVFRGIPWGTGTVLTETLVRTESQGLNVRMVPPLIDIDTGEDLERLYRLWTDDAPEENSVYQWLRHHAGLKERK